MSPIIIAMISIAVLVVFILIGIRIGYALTIMSFLGVWLSFSNFDRATTIISATTFSAIRDYTFCVTPLFLVMGSLMSESGAAEDLFRFANYFMKKIPGGLAISTVFGNAIFAACTGISVASASVFSQIAIPPMAKLKYDKGFAVGSVAGSSVLGMLIPPSLLFIIYGTTAEVSIGKLFMAGILPGLTLASIFIIGIIIMSMRNPSLVGLDPKKQKSASSHKIQTSVEKKVQQLIATDEPFPVLLLRTLPIIAIILIVLGGIWGGVCTPTEASALGALAALIVTFLKKKIKVDSFKKLMFESTISCVSILFLLTCAQMYSRMLGVTGLVSFLSKSILSLQVPQFIIIGIFLVLVLAMGCILDSTSILLLTVPLMKPIVVGLGFDLIWFGIVLVITVEMGLLTPPFGMVAFAIKSALGDIISLDEIFKGSIPFLLMMFIGLLIIIFVPQISTFLPSIM
jgi:tripartite ATP-independent transporter DctM subunit